MTVIQNKQPKERVYILTKLQPIPSFGMIYFDLKVHNSTKSTLDFNLDMQKKKKRKESSEAMIYKSFFVIPVL